MAGSRQGTAVVGARECRFCAAPLTHVFCDLGMSPLCESFRTADELDAMEPFYPLRVHVCGKCFLVQLPEYVAPEDIFTEYAYFSSFSDSWVAHAERFAEMAIERFDLGPASLVVEAASNDGYLLAHFVARGVPVLGIEPARNVAKAAVARGVPTRTVFLGAATARDLTAEGVAADLVVGNNVLAQVPDLNDFVIGLRTLLAPTGVLTLEFPSLRRLIDGNQFDTIYHEHFSYFTLTTAAAVLAAHGLTVVDVEQVPTHGGSLRLFARHAAAAGPPSAAVETLLAEEAASGLTDLTGYAGFGPQVEATKRALLTFLLGAKEAGRTVVGYGAPGKGNTLLNYCGVRTDFLQYTVDRNPYKQGRFLPGTHIPINSPERIRETRPDFVLILPWNLRDEIALQLDYIREWGGRCVVPIPRVEVLA